MCVSSEPPNGRALIFSSRRIVTKTADGRFFRKTPDPRRVRRAVFEQAEQRAGMNLFFGNLVPNG